MKGMITRTNNTTVWDTAVWVQNAADGSVTTHHGIVLGWQAPIDPETEAEGPWTPIVHGLDDLTEGEMVLINSASGRALWGETEFFDLLDALAHVAAAEEEAAMEK